MKTLATQTLVGRLVQRMDLHRVFLFSYPFLEEEQHHLLLVINPVKGLSPKAMAPIVSLCMSDTTEVPFDMILAGEWQNQLKQGSLYYTYASLPQHELFAASKKKSPLLSHKTITGLLELSQLNYGKCRKTSDEFREAVNNFVIKRDYGQATFMLHQFLAVRLKGFQATAGVNGGKSHNVEYLMKSLRALAPQILSIFPYDSPSVDLFRLLDESYVKGKKMDIVEITTDQFSLLLEKCEQASAMLDSMVATMMERIAAYREQLADEVKLSGDVKGEKAPVLAIDTNPSPSQLVCEDFSGFPWPDSYKQDVNSLLNSFRQKHNPEQIMMLNYHTGGFSGSNLFQQPDGNKEQGAKVELYLVVLMKNKGPFRFKRVQAGVASALVVYLNVEYVKKKLSEGDRFVHTLWTKGRVLRRKSIFTPSFTVTEVDWKAEYERVKNLWENARGCMSNLKEVVVQTPNLMLDTGMLLLKDLLEMGVHTYLQCAVGYLPRQVHLTELIDWSGITGRRVLDFIYPKSETDRARLHLMFRPESIWWENATIGLSKTSQSFYCDQAKDLLRFFDGLCEEVLEELKNKAEKVEDNTKEPEPNV
ncbi:HEPN domain-containing protein [Olivibacter sp. SDN3]|uniref:HEPN domain-containing protein n=1 Tax=Olivibacter sp. SDN3 TaxID=2764720 RepID=UPI0016514989|nr:HEPN domain-containing protein [Olivibacter sp. SDN3]QNL50954.1 HEPN domain-containing protein [Olivibacter sp. SDN3]